MWPGKADVPLCLHRFKRSTTTFPTLERAIYSKLFFALVPIVIVFGPILGIAAATEIYGVHSEHSAQTGMDLRRAATWVRLC